MTKKFISFFADATLEDLRNDHSDQSSIPENTLLFQRRAIWERPRKLRQKIFFPHCQRKIKTGKSKWLFILRKKQPFTLITEDEELANRLKAGDKTVGTMKLLFLGGGATAGAIAGVTGATKIAVVGAIAAAADPEPISKTILASATAVLAVTAAGTALLLVKRLYDGQLKPKSFEFNPPRFKMEFYP